MEQQQIKYLLDKYLAGETSLEEEGKLRNYFANHTQLPPEMEVYRVMFGYFEQEQHKAYQGDVLLPKPRSYKWLVGVGSIAAVIILLFVFSPLKDTNTLPAKGNVETATQNTRSLFMIMGSAPEESKENLEYLEELNVLSGEEITKEKENRVDSLNRKK